MWRSIVSPVKRYAQGQTLSRIAQIAGSMVVAEALPMPASQSAVHSGVRIDTNGSSADGKGTSSKQVSGFDAFKSESMVRGNVQRYSIAGSAVLTSVNS